MPGFSYPAPFEFENEEKPHQQPRQREPRHPRQQNDDKNGVAERRTPSRSKSNEESFFSAGSVAPTTQRRMGPKTKSGRHLPKPAPSIPIRGKNPPAHRSVGKTQSSNLEQMQIQTGARTRSSSVPKSPRVARVSEVEEEQEQESSAKKPSSLKNFLTLKKKDGRDDELKGSLHSLQTSKSTDSQRSGTFKFLTRKSVSAKANQRPVDQDRVPVNYESDNAPSNTSSTRRRKKAAKEYHDYDDNNSNNNDDNETSSRRDKPKSFKQLLAKKQPNSNNTTIANLEIADGDKHRRRRETRAVSPSPARRSLEREPSLSPVEVKKPGSLLTNLLDSLYDSYIDPKARDDDDDDSEELANLHSSVSRFDMSLSGLF